MSTVSYYAITTTASLNTNETGAGYYDIRTINRNDDGGSNYNFSVLDSWETASGATTWSSPSSWAVGEVPVADQPVIILETHDLTLDVDASVSSLTIQDHATFIASDATPRTLTLTDTATLRNHGTFSANNGTVAFTGAGSISGTITFNNLDVSGAVNPGAEAIINGTLSLLSGGSITTETPIYGPNSTLRYNTLSTVNPGTEWPAGSESLRNVSLEGNNTAVSFGTSDEERTVRDHLIIGPNTTLQLSSQSGGNLVLFGDWTIEGTFDANNRTVYFEGSAPQNVTNTSPGGLEIDFLMNENTAGGTGLSINDTISVFQLNNDGILNLGSNDLIVKDGASSRITNDGTLNMSNNTVVFEGMGSISGGTITMHNLEIGGGVAIPAPPTISNRLVVHEGGYLAQAPGGARITEEDHLLNYATGATLVYTGSVGVDDVASGWGTGIENTSKNPDNVAVEGSGDLSISVERSVSGELRIEESAMLDTGGNLIIESDAFLANDGTVNNVVNFQRLITNPGTEQANPNDRWVALAAPTSDAVFSEGDVSNPTNVDRALLRKVWTQGFPGANDERTNIEPSVLLFDTGAGEYVRPAGNDITAGRGFFAFMYESKDRDDNSGNSDVDFTDPFAVQGNINASAFSYTSLVDQGFNFLGNPTAAPVDWAATESGAWTKTNVQEWMWLWDAANNQFLLRSDSDAALGPAVIAPFQAFLVFADASPALELGPEARTTDNTSNAGLFDTPERAFITIELEAGEKSSKTHFRFDETYGESFSSRDAPFLTPLATSFAYTYSVKQQQAAMLNSLPADRSTLEIPLAAGAFAQGTFYEGPARFTWPTFEYIPESWDIILQDSFTGASVNLRDEEGYDFMMAPGLNHVRSIQNFRELKQDDSPAINPDFTGQRFVLIVEQDGEQTSAPVDGELPGEIALKQNYPNPFNPTTQIAYALPEASEVRLEVFNVQGQRVATLVNRHQQAGSHEINFDAADLASGVYLYRLNASNENGHSMLTGKMTLLK